MNVESHRYRAFISYSHRDKVVVRWLHRALETYRIPRKLVGRVTSVGAVPRRVAPIFRDRDELSASGDLSTELRARLEQTLFLIVVCSPSSARSTYVNEEVLAFKRLHGEGRVLALIIAGEPGGSATGGPEEECFPPALRYRLDEQGRLSAGAAEPIAADLRKHADGKRLALMKLLAGLTGLPLDDLVRREAQRRNRRLTAVAITSLGAAVLTGGLALYANAKRIEADEQRAQADAARHVAERESAAARAAADFLVSTFTISNPATENPRTITALTILARSAERAHADLANQPGIQVRLVTTVARAYQNLGLLKEARGALESAMPSIQALGAEGVPALLALAQTYYQEDHFNEAAETVRLAEQKLGPDSSTNLESRGYAAEVMAEIEDDGNMQPAKAVLDYDRALSIYARIPNIEARTVARALNNRGLALSAMARFDEAKDSMMRANVLLRNAFGDNHRLVGQSFEALAQNAQNAGDLADAQDYISRSVSILQRVLDADNPILADSLLMQGVIYDGEKKIVDAQESLQKALAVYKKSYGGPHLKIGIAEVYLSQVESELGNVTQALADLDDAKHNYDVSYGHLHANHGDLLVYRAMVLKRANRMAEARRDCTQGLEIIKQVGDGDSGLYKADAEMCRTL